MTDTQPLKNFEFGNHTDVGLHRQQNEDYLGYFDTPNGHVFLVCDGMGGHAGGATASRLAVNTMRDFFQAGPYPSLPEACAEALRQANQAILRRALERPELLGMGTTAVVVVVRGSEVWYAHVGDSRLYLLRNGQLQQLTRDHSFVQTLVDQGLISKREAENHPRRNELTQALGVEAEVRPEVSEQPLQALPGDLFLLCTDGLNGYASESAIQHVLEEPVDVQLRAIRLVELANAGGGGDNTTVQLIHFPEILKKAAGPPVSQTLKPENPARPGGNASKTPPTAENGWKNRPRLLWLLALAGTLAFLTVAAVLLSTAQEPMESASAASPADSTRQVAPPQDTVWITLYTDKTMPVDSLTHLYGISEKNLRLATGEAPTARMLPKRAQVTLPVRDTIILTDPRQAELLALQYDTDLHNLLKTSHLKAEEFFPGDTVIIPFRLTKVPGADTLKLAKTPKRKPGASGKKRKRSNRPANLNTPNRSTPANRNQSQR